MSNFPTCGRRHPARRVKPLDLLPWETSPLGAWRPEPKRSPAAGPVPRLVLLHACLNSDGEPRGGIVRPDGTTVAFYDLAAAAAALRNMEVRP